MCMPAYVFPSGSKDWYDLARGMYNSKDEHDLAGLREPIFLDVGCCSRAMFGCAYTPADI
jgi:hypothetical protein